MMGIARDNGNRGGLSAMVELVWERLRELGNARAVFAYLAKLARQRKDYARLCAIRGQSEDPGSMSSERAKRLAEKLPVFIQRAVGMVLALRDGRELGVVKADGGRGWVDVVDERGVRRTLPVNARVVEGWEEGAYILRPVRVKQQLPVR